MTNYNTTLQSNNTDLQAIHNSINELPEASSSGGTIIEDALITRTFATYTNNRVTSIGNGAFAYAIIQSIDIPECKIIGRYAFVECDRLTTVSFPVCQIISESAFYQCNALQTISFPLCTTIGYSAFNRCYSLATISFPVCTTISNSAFLHCEGLQTISLPICTTIGTMAFGYCSSLSTVNLPACTTIGSLAFADCYNLTTVDFSVCKAIDLYTFRSCYNLSSIILRASNICTLSASNAFNSTPYEGYSSSFSGTPYIYVPASLIDSYKTATNWTYFSSYFSTIESIGQ